MTGLIIAKLLRSLGFRRSLWTRTGWEHPWSRELGWWLERKARKLTGRCPTCGLPKPHHKMDCYYGRR